MDFGPVLSPKSLNNQLKNRQTLYTKEYGI